MQVYNNVRQGTSHKYGQFWLHVEPCLRMCNFVDSRLIGEIFGDAEIYLMTAEEHADIQLNMAQMIGETGGDLAKFVQDIEGERLPLFGRYSGASVQRDSRKASEASAFDMTARRGELRCTTTPTPTGPDGRRTPSATNRWGISSGMGVFPLERSTLPSAAPMKKQYNWQLNGPWQRLQ